ncbi:MAG: DUF192 domain-containing protein [Gemmatimonadota bacterium]|nr:DUF192 domain-containing protein [Gemmatimonadota bacterium]
MLSRSGIDLTSPGDIPRRGPAHGLAVLILAAAAVACGGGGGAASETSGDPAVPEQETAGAVEPGPDGGLVRSVPIRVGGVPITVEIADTPPLRERGLMHRDSLPADHGMLFVYPDEQLRSFWMRNTKIPLDIGFFDRNGSLLNVERMEPRTEENTLSKAPAMYALEMNAGWFEAHGVGPGDRLEF